MRSVLILDRLVQSDVEGWRILGWAEEAKKVIEKAMEAKDAKTQAACVALVNRLVAKGHMGFRELLDKNDNTHGGEETRPGRTQIDRYRNFDGA